VGLSTPTWIPQAVALRRRSLGRLAQRTTRTRRQDDRCVRVALGDFIVDIVPIERAVTDEGYDWRCHMVEQSADLRAIVVIIGRQPDRHDLTGVGVYAEMECSPGPTCLRAMLLDQSVAGTAQLQLGAVHQQMHGLVPRSRSRHLQCFGSPAQCRTVGHGKIEAEQGNDVTERTT